MPCDDIPSDDEYRMIVKKIIEKKKEGAPIICSYKTLNYFLQWPFGYQKDKVGKNEGLRIFNPPPSALGEDILG